jgi:hypothetical protein
MLAGASYWGAMRIAVHLLKPQDSIRRAYV